MHVGLALPVLCTFLERPFVTRAGVQHDALAYSLQANLLSPLMTGIAGFVLLGVFWRLGADQMLTMWIGTALALTILIEYAWLRRQSGQRIRWDWIVAGNILSAAVVFTLPFWRDWFDTNSHSYILTTGRYCEHIVLLTLLACLAIYAAAFWRTGLKRRAKFEPRGFEVLPMNSA